MNPFGLAVYMNVKKVLYQVKDRVEAFVGLAWIPCNEESYPPHIKNCAFYKRLRLYFNQKGV